MAWFPRASKKEIKPGSNDPAIKVVGVILHVDAGNSSSLYNYFNGPSGGIESHFHIRLDGTVEQYRDTGREADANYKANSFVDGGTRKGFVSIETQGYENGEWTYQQLKAIKDLLVWLSDTHDFDLEVATNPRGPGVGYHVMFGAPGAWTPSAKTCPGPKRIAQFNKEIVPWMRARSKPKPKPETPKNPKVDLSDVIRAARKDPGGPQGHLTAKTSVMIVENALVKEGLLAKKWADGSFGTKTIEAYAKWQRRCGYTGADADGVPGRASLNKLGDKYGFDVVS